MQMLSQKLVSLRKSKNLTQQQLAEKINYSDKVISKWERGESVPDISAMNVLAKFYDTTLDELVNTCNLIKSEEPTSHLKKLGLFFHILLTLLPIMSLTMFLCCFGYPINHIWYVHNWNSILLVVLLTALSAFTILDMILCHLKVKRIWVAYTIFAIICTLILFLIISCIIYGTFATSTGFGFRNTIFAVIASIISVGFGYIFYKKQSVK